MKAASLTTIAAILLLVMFPVSALAAWPSGSQGDQYAAVNAAMETAVAGEGISPETFILIYDTAVAGGDLSGFTEAQLNAACQVLSSLSSYQSVLADYNTVYSNLGCSSRLVSSEATRGTLPSTGIAAITLLGIGVIVTGSVFVIKWRRADNS